MSFVDYMHLTQTELDRVGSHRVTIDMRSDALGNYDVLISGGPGRTNWYQALPLVNRLSELRCEDLVDVSVINIMNEYLVQP